MELRPALHLVALFANRENCSELEGSFSNALLGYSKSENSLEQALGW